VTAKQFLKSRLNELEAKMSLAHGLLDALNRIAFSQQQIDRLQQAIRTVREQLPQAAPPGAAGPGDEITPR
jgi:uncharacterized coiled-coil protein SlyX